MEVSRIRGQNRQWTDEEMFQMIDKINAGYTYQDVTDGTHVPISTLWTRVKGLFSGEVRPKIGAPHMFSEEMEADIALFMKHCSFLCVPHTREILKQDILHFVQYKDLSVPKMAEDGPGRSYFDRFATDWKDLVQFHTKAELFQIENDPITIKDWVYERDHYTRLQLMTRYFSSRKYIFVIETEVLKIESSNKIEYTVVIVYNAEGQMLIPFVPHSPNMPEVINRHFKNKINFFKTADGKLDRNCLCILMYVISLYLINNDLKESPIIYLAPDLAKHISFFMWDIANRQKIVLQTIPKNIYRYFKTSNMGIYEKLKPQFNNFARERFPDKSMTCLNFHFFDNLTKTMESLKVEVHLRNSCRHLRIVHVSPEIADVQEETVDD